MRGGSGPRARGQRGRRQRSPPVRRMCACWRRAASRSACSGAARGGPCRRTCLFLGSLYILMVLRRLVFLQTARYTVAKDPRPSSRMISWFWPRQHVPGPRATVRAGHHRRGAAASEGGGRRNPSAKKIKRDARPRSAGGGLHDLARKSLCFGGSLREGGRLSGEWLARLAWPGCGCRVLHHQASLALRNLCSRGRWAPARRNERRRFPRRAAGCARGAQWLEREHPRA